MPGRRELRSELNTRAVVLPNIEGKQYSRQEIDEYFRFVKMERARTGKDPSGKIIAALRQANEVLTKNKMQKEVDVESESDSVSSESDPSL